MAIYVMNYVLIPIYDFFIRDRKVLVFIISLQMFLILALRSESMGVDVDNYAIYYESYAQHSFFEILKSLTVFGNAKISYGLESGYVLYNYIIAKLGFSFHGFLVVTAAIVMFSIGNFVYDYSKNPGLSFAFITTFIYGTFFGILRQSLGLAFFLLAILQLKKGNLYRSLFLVWVSTSFHTAFFFAVPFFVFSRLEVRKRNFVGLLGLLLVLIVSVPVLFKVAINPVLAFLGRGYILSSFSWNNMFALMIAFLLLLYCNYARSFDDSIVIYGCFYTMLIQTMAFYIPIFSRLAIGVFFIFFCIALPNLVSNTRQVGISNHIVDSFTSLFLNKNFLYFVLLVFYITTLKDSANVPYITQF